MKNNHEINELVLDVVALAYRAGEAILTIYQQQSPLVTQIKADNSPLTAADLASHHQIVAGLKQLTPTIPILSEEGPQTSYALRGYWPRYWLIDPLDGTKEFICGSGEFTVNIALVEHGQVMLGVVYAPLLQHCYFATRGYGAFKQIAQQAAQAIHTRLLQHPIAVATSRHHKHQQLACWLAQLPDYQLSPMGSSLKFCLVAEGAVDIYPRVGLTSEWDTAAAQCIVEAAGGEVIDPQGKPLRYNQQESLLNPAFIALGDPNSMCRQLWLARN